MRLPRYKPTHKVTLSGAAANAARHAPTLARAWQSRIRKFTGQATGSDHDYPSDPANSVRYFANAGPQFEPRATPDYPSVDTQVKAVAFYLPQFHAFPENDAWWGEGFTEWRNVSRGMPRFQGHYQPRIPRDLGFYDLNDASVIAAQAKLASAAGIQAFCFYYYWFNGKRLMEKPLDTFAGIDIDQEFCIMWANENWTRRWDGRDQDVLIAQNYDEADEEAFLADTAKYMAHPRYLRVAGKPLFILYRASLVPDTANTIARWRDKWSTILGVEPHIYMIQSYADVDPLQFGMDGAIEFPPHKVSRDIRRRNHEYPMFDPDYAGQIRDYQDVVNKSLNEPAPAYPLVKTVSPSWDNDARREGRGVTFQGSSPEAYHQWLSGAIQFAKNHPVADESMVFINAWNEWAEAAYLEPDVHYGHAYLNATYRALTQKQDTSIKPSLLLVGHDAHANGAQMLLLSLARLFTEELHVPVKVLLKSGGALLEQYQAIASVTLLNTIKHDELQAWFNNCGCQYALFNTSVTGDLLPAARKARMHSVSLVHEMPALIRNFNLQTQINEIAHLANHIVFPSTHVKAGFESFEPVISSAVSIRPQGLYKTINVSSSDRKAIRQELNLPESAKVVLNLGYADERKGFDLFVNAALRLHQQHPDVHFCWVGKRNRAMSRWLKKTVRKKPAAQLHVIDFTSDVSPWYAAADCLYLSSREDPFPSVVLEAMNIGLPVVVHSEATGFDDPLLELIYQAPADSHAGLDEALLQALNDDDPALREARKALIRKHYLLKEYGTFLLSLFPRECVAQQGNGSLRP